MHDTQKKTVKILDDIVVFHVGCKNVTTRIEMMAFASIPCRSPSVPRKCIGYEVCRTLVSVTFVLTAFNFDTYSSSDRGVESRNGNTFSCKLCDNIILTVFKIIETLFANFINLQISASMNVKIQVFWDVTPCGLLNR